MEIAWPEKGKKSFRLCCPVLCVFSRVSFTLGRGIGSEKKEGECSRMENIAQLEDAIIAPTGSSVPRAGTDPMPFWKNLSPNSRLLVTTITTKPSSVQLVGARGGCLYNASLRGHTGVRPLGASHAPYWRKQACFRIKGPPKCPFPSNSLPGEPTRQRGCKVQL